MPVIPKKLRRVLACEQMSFDFELNDFSKEAESLPKTYQWTDEDIEKIREGLFNQSLRLLGDGRAGAEAQKETYEWMMSDEIHPFSFLVCCHYESVNPERIRKGMLQVMRNMKISVN